MKIKNYVKVLIIPIHPYLFMAIKMKFSRKYVIRSSFNQKKKILSRKVFIFDSVLAVPALHTLCEILIQLNCALQELHCVKCGVVFLVLNPNLGFNTDNEKTAKQTKKSKKKKVLYLQFEKYEVQYELYFCVRNPWISNSSWNLLSLSGNKSERP